MTALPRRSLLALLAAPAIARAAETQPAGSWPARPVQVIVPIAAGGPTDAIARILAQHLPPLLNDQPFVVDNRPGAGGQIGMRAAAGAAPDGYTMVIGNTGSVAINPLYQPNAGYTAADYTYASMLMVAPVVLVVRADLPVRTVQDLVGYIRARDRDFAFASSGQGQSPDIAARLFLKSAGLEAAVASYRGAAPAVTDLLAGVVQAMFDTTTSLPHVKEGRLRIIAVANAERSALLPEVPTMAEQGFAGFDVSSWYVAMMPKGTPAPILRRLSGAIATVMQRPEVARQLAGLDAQPLHGTPEAARDFVNAQVEHWRDVLRSLEVRAG
ncbi:MAG TPA: tripartite tricarboxylate transporter substrate binding protein [Roseomonas sp.]|nr:tripartite tricarboxylate transporter substrate binding protein [Roseomonas sp.]